MNMDNDKKRLAGKAIRSEQVATAILSNIENEILNRGTKLSISILDAQRDPITFELPEGAEDAVVYEIEKQVPGYINALDKWSRIFQQTFSKKDF